MHYVHTVQKNEVIADTTQLINDLSQTWGIPVQ